MIGSGFDSPWPGVKTGVITEHGGEKPPAIEKSFSFDNHMPKSHIGTLTITSHVEMLGLRQDLKKIDTGFPCRRYSTTPMGCGSHHWT